MEVGTTTTPLTAKLPILNPGKYDIWLMRIEQYFLMTDYSLWEVIKNDRKNEIKARGTLLMALLNKDQQKFHSYQDAKLLMRGMEETRNPRRLQKLISQLEIQGEVIKQEDINLKLLRSLQSEWKTHALIWRNKADIETISLDDFANSTSSTNEADNTAYGVSTTHTQEMDLHWEMAMQTIRARRFIKRTGRNLDINGQKISFNRSKVKCFNYHKNGHFARECKALKNQENRGRGYGRKTVPVENPTENALIAQDGIRGYDWSYQAKEEHHPNYALMALTSSRSSSSSDSEVDSCSKTCIKAYATLKDQYDSLSLDYKKS
nr:hypothetical protein [Tanacetum cinerariifolium]